MNDARTLARIVQSRVRHAAQDSRAFEVGEVVGDSATGTIQVDVPGMGTLEEIPRTGTRVPARIGQQVLLVRIAGSAQNACGLTRAPFNTGASSSVSVSIPH